MIMAPYQSTHNLNILSLCIADEFNFVNIMPSGNEGSDITLCVAVTPVATSTNVEITIDLNTVNNPPAGKMTFYRTSFYNPGSKCIYS